MRERNRVIVSIVILVAIAAIAAARIASAHGALESSNPEADSVVPELPEQVSARFSEEVDPEGSRMSVRGPGGEVADAGDGGANLNDPDRTLMTVTLLPDLPQGEYTVEWLTVSAEDGHTEEGSFTFTLDPDAPDVETPAVVAPVETPEPLPTGEVGDSAGASRGAIVVGIVAVVVALSVVAAVGRRRPWR